jgi:hypothetical protein
MRSVVTVDRHKGQTPFRLAAQNRIHGTRWREVEIWKGGLCGLVRAQPDGTATCDRCQALQGAACENLIINETFDFHADSRKLHRADVTAFIPYFLFELCVSGCMIGPTPVFIRL